MNKITSEKLVEHLYYRKLPQVYRDSDKELTTYPLKRYLTALFEGGFKLALEDTNNFLDLVNPEKCPEQYLPIMCQSFGLEYCEDIPVFVQRKLLMNIGELNKRRGTYSCVTYLVRTLTSLDCELHYSRLENGERQLQITLFARTYEALKNMSTDIKIVENYVRYFIPYYIVPIIIDSRIEVQHIDLLRLRANALSVKNEYELLPAGVDLSVNLRQTKYVSNAVCEGKEYTIK